LATIALAIVAAVFLGNFPISRKDHEARVIRLAARKANTPTETQAEGTASAAFVDPDASTAAP